MNFILCRHLSAGRLVWNHLSFLNASLSIFPKSVIGEIEGNVSRIRRAEIRLQIGEELHVDAVVAQIGRSKEFLLRPLELVYQSKPRQLPSSGKVRHLSRRVSRDARGVKIVDLQNREEISGERSDMRRLPRVPAGDPAVFERHALRERDDTVIEPGFSVTRDGNGISADLDLVALFGVRDAVGSLAQPQTDGHGSIRLRGADVEQLSERVPE